MAEEGHLYAMELQGNCHFYCWTTVYRNCVSFHCKGIWWNIQLFYQTQHNGNMVLESILEFDLRARFGHRSSQLNQT